MEALYDDYRISMGSAHGNLAAHSAVVE